MDLETVKTFKGNLEVKFRPIKPSDEDKMRRLFYDFSDESKYLRYFVRIQVMPHRDMQKYLNVDYNETLSIVGTVQRGRAEKIIAEGRYAYFAREQSYETAFLVDEEYQGRGIATFLVNYLIMIAKQRGLKKLSASVLPENDKMLRVFRNADVEPKITYVDGAMEVLFNLEEEKESEGN